MFNYYFSWKCILNIFLWYYIEIHTCILLNIAKLEQPQQHDLFFKQTYAIVLCLHGKVLAERNCHELATTLIPHPNCTTWSRQWGRRWHSWNKEWSWTKDEGSSFYFDPWPFPPTLLRGGSECAALWAFGSHSRLIHHNC